MELNTCVFNGQAAVIAFFLISGFCIHFPYASGRRFELFPFLLSRLVRIMIPVAAYLFLLRIVPGTDSTTQLRYILWSVWCELIYYGLYPVLRLCFARTSVMTVLLLSYLGAAAAVVYGLKAVKYSLYFDAGSWTWLAGLPCWLLGCLLAERFSAVGTAPAIDSPKKPSLRGLLSKIDSVWLFRAGAIFLGLVTYYAMRNRNVSFLITLHVFAIFSYFWLQSELRHYMTRPANKFLERLGSLTFSIYLIHLLSIFVWNRFFPTTGFFMWAAKLGFALLVSAVFYGLVERPSHLLAQKLSRRAKTPEVQARTESVSTLAKN